MELHYPFLCFSVDDILVLISCILTQHRLVFMASSYATITLVIEVHVTTTTPTTFSYGTPIRKGRGCSSYCLGVKWYRLWC